MRARSRRTYSWSQRGPSPPAAAISSCADVVIVETQKTVPEAVAARAVATSPSGSSSRCIANGATRTGSDTGVPSKVVAADAPPTSTSTRGRKRQRPKAARLARSVTSSPAPPSK